MNDLRTLPAFTVTETPEGVLIAKTRAATKLALCAYPGMDGALYEALWHWAQLYANGLAVTHEGAVVTLPPAAAQALIRRVKAYAAWAAAREALIREGWAPPRVPPRGPPTQCPGALPPAPRPRHLRPPRCPHPRLPLMPPTRLTSD